MFIKGCGSNFGCGYLVNASLPISPSLVLVRDPKTLLGCQQLISEQNRFQESSEKTSGFVSDGPAGDKARMREEEAGCVDVRVAVWGWSGGGLRQRLVGGLRVGELLEVKEILTGGEWALASRPGEKKVQFFCCSPSNKHDRGGGAESLFCFVTFAAQPSRSLVRTERFEVKKMQLFFFFKGPVII